MTSRRLPARALWIFASALFGAATLLLIFFALPSSQSLFMSICNESGCSQPPMLILYQMTSFLLPSAMLAGALIAVFAIVATAINRAGGLGPTDPRAGGRRTTDADAELDELLSTASDDLGRTRSGGASKWRGGDLTPFMRPPDQDR